MQSVVVTGVSTGIGEAIARLLVARGFQVFGSVRKPQDGARLAAALGSLFTPLVFDTTDRDAVFAGAAQVKTALNGAPLFGLVNNAGIAVAGLLLYMTPEEIRQQMDVNLQGTLNATQAFAPLLGAVADFTGTPGKIVMISSVAGTSATPFMGAYNISKFALEGMSEALRRELMLFGVDVVVIAPGAVKTPIWDKGLALNDARYTEGPFAAPLGKMRELVRSKAHIGLDPDVIATATFKALTGKAPVRQVLTPEPLMHFLLNHLPKRMVDRMFAKMLSLKRVSKN
ncbi:MAG: short chain dehydrogenase/reductase family oxidoreductase [Alphaproteobacteria bacterium]|nr:short chain dehydrogenase/reductase family oxidoreductase [Alphaproteobacteria bacterium]